MWQHAEVYNAILGNGVRRARNSVGHTGSKKAAEFSWHVIWLFHGGYIGFPANSGFPLPAKDPRAVVLAKNCSCGDENVIRDVGSAA